MRRSYTSKASGQDMKLQLEFELDDEVFVGQGSISTMDLSEFARLANQGVDSSSPEGIAILADIYLSLLGNTEYQRFRRHCRAHGTEGGVLVEILGGLMSEGSGRPTQRPSDSSDGPTTGAATATVVSFSRGTVEQVEVKPETEMTQAEETPKVVSYG